MEKIEAILAQIGDNPLTMARFANVLASKGQHNRAQELSKKALALAPHDGEVRVLAMEVLMQDVPSYYFHMVTDHSRHAAYEEAFRRAIKPGDLVLDIGSGTGLFALIAARLGARVVTCDANPVVARTVGEIVAKNGYSDRIKVVPKQSSDLQIGVDLERPADAIIWDNLANNVISAGALSTFENAVKRLGVAGARVVPAIGTVRIALAEDLNPYRMNDVEGFDLSAFNQLAPTRYLVTKGAEHLAPRSAAANLFSFDFRTGGPFPEARTTIRLVSTGGTVNGVIQWPRVDLDDNAVYENHPPLNSNSAWGGIFHRFDRPLVTKEGDTIMVGGSHDRQKVLVWLIEANQ